jgi:hypothetical protein
MKILLLFFFISNLGRAEEIEEAVGLPDEVTTQVSAHHVNENWRHRSFILLEGISRNATGSKNEFPNFEADLTTDYKTRGVTLFFDGYAKRTQIDQKTLGYTNQFGVRYQTAESFNLAVGKERNRRSPGIIISPSDLLFSQTNLPGLTEDRWGVWLARTSYQMTKSSYDLFVLPVSSQTEGGWPDENSKYLGTMARSLQQFENWDVSVSVGSINENTRAGLAVQGIVAEVWKTYYEVGYFGNHSQSQQLLGLSYEGSDDFSVKGEYFYNEVGISEEPTLFTQKQYAIFTASALELFNRYNLITSIVKSLEDSRALTIFRAEFLATDHLVAGITSIFLTSSQQYNFDLKYSF